MQSILLLLWLACVRVVGLARRRLMPESAARDRGDVPGWVLITVMSAGIVAALWTFAGPRLEDMLSTALDGVRGP